MGEYFNVTNIVRYIARLLLQSYIFAAAAVTVVARGRNDVISFIMNVCCDALFITTEFSVYALCQLAATVARLGRSTFTFT